MRNDMLDHERPPKQAKKSSRSMWLLFYLCSDIFFVDKKLNSYIRRKKYESVQVHETKYYGAI